MNRIAVSVLAITFLVPAWARSESGAPPAAEAFAKCAARYRQLKTYTIEAKRQTIVSQAGQSGSMEAKTVLAVGGQGRVYVDYEGQHGHEIRVSNGLTTWKALSSEKAWTREDVAEIAGDSDDADQSPPGDLANRMQRELTQRYTVLLRYASVAEFLKQDHLKFGGVKTLCNVYRVPASTTTNDIWIAADTYYVLRHVETSPKGIQVTTEYKRIDAGAPNASLFDFQPPNGSHQVAGLMLPDERNVSLVGEHAADFTLKTLSGEPVSLSALQGKVVLLDFWASWCSPCRQELPAIVAISRKYKDKNVVVLGVNDEDTRTAQHFLEKTDYDFTVLHDGDRKVSRLYGCSSIPMVVVINPAGKIVAHFVGGRDESQLVAALKEAGMS